MSKGPPVIPFIPPYFPTQAPVIPAQSQPRGHTHVSRARKHTDKRPKRHASISSNTAVWDSMAGSTVCGNGTESIAGRSIRSSASSAPDNNTYERQRQVAHWVEDTDAHASRFINPFAPPSDPSTPRTNSYQPRTKEDAARAMSGGKRKSMPPVWVPAPTVLPAQQPPQVPTIIVQPPQYIPPPQMMPPPQMILQVPSTPHYPANHYGPPPPAPITYVPQNINAEQRPSFVQRMLKSGGKRNTKDR